MLIAHALAIAVWPGVKIIAAVYPTATIHFAPPRTEMPRIAVTRRRGRKRWRISRRVDEMKAAIWGGLLHFKRFATVLVDRM